MALGLPTTRFPGGEEQIRDSRYDVLFEPVRIGRFTTRNRFYQPPHCNGMGNLRPQAHAAMRGIKAEGGWAVVNTEHCSIHPTSDLMPEVLQSLWDEDDIPPLALMCDAVHAHGSLAGVQLAYAAYYNANKLSREIPMGPMGRPVDGTFPLHARAMDLADIRNLRRWWREAAERARRCGFDIVNVDANFSTIAFQFLSPRNQRADEYGGSLRNRARLLRELIEETRAGVQDACAVSVRLIVDELCGDVGLRAEEEGIEAISLLAELPDLWDIVIGTWAGDSPTARFAPENDHERFLAGIKQVTTRPVVGVGRFTSPDTMVSLVRRGILDMIGATRPSIADPFLPSKIEEGRLEDIRECIGCNICVSSHFMMTNLRCTQNPTIGEEWRRDWHPEILRPRDREETVLVVGAGPAGLECARVLAERGYDVMLAERSRELGGRLLHESRLPGMTTYLRVRDWRAGQIARLPNVAVFRESIMDRATILETGAAHVILATGSVWRRDGVSRLNGRPLSLGAIPVLTPDDIFAGAKISGRVMIYDEDHYYMGGLLAEQLARAGADVILVTPEAELSAFTANTLELQRIALRLDEAGVTGLTHHVLVGADSGGVELRHRHTSRPRTVAVDMLVLVTARQPVDELYRDLAGAVIDVVRIGDCLAPGAVFHAVHGGHRAGREFGAAEQEIPFRRERIDLARV
ncbi:dimethylamine/trimethylamine dehydrogenase [Dongia mobilis]|uniref:Dimethylamine/trimethylamine dehydrogenase n=1 Tax=Dongia mobilis TaxID=578943 RepID=A0A4R6X0Z8_9PROT|nr:FAD-dependent oxidoreductase [Dongia mobilis]TDQ84128.1 dimethylamine/trimethylamine dehydrogenase [Dongia mobilis]